MQRYPRPWLFAELLRMRPAGPIRLLHLSDLHFSKRRAWEQDPVLAGLVRDVAELQPQLGEIHRVVVTGDIADWGKKEEYGKAAEWLAGPLARAAGVAAPSIRVVAGNHDVDRSVIGPDVVGMDEGVIEGRDGVIASIMQDKAKRKRILSRQAAFLSFAKRFHPGLALPWWRSEEDIAGWKVCFYGLNTGWLAGSHRNQRGEVDDNRHLAIGSWQWDSLFRAADEPSDLDIALMHHPWEDLAEWDRIARREATLERCGLVLSGHMHDADMRDVRRPGRQVLELAAGACYSDPGEGWPHAYQFLELDPGREEAKIYLRKWHLRTRKWIADNERYPDGMNGGVAILQLRRSPHASLRSPATSPTSARLQTTPPPDPEARLRDLIGMRIDDLPAVFEAPGQRNALSEVYVELALSPVALPPGKDWSPEAATVRRIEDALDHPIRRWVLRGEAGCGKTTLLYHLADVLLKDRSRNLLPVPLRVADLERNDRLVDAVSRAYDAEAAALVVAACASGRAVVLLDGLDEAVDPDNARAAVQSLTVDVGLGVIVVSSRDTAYTRPGAGFGELRVRPLTREQQLDLLACRVGRVRARSELEVISRHSRLARMAKNPLLLTLMGLVLQGGEGGSLSARRAELYDRAVGLLLRGAHRPEHTRGFDDPPLVREILARLALALHGPEQTTWPLVRLREAIEGDARSWPRVEKNWHSADRFLREVAHVSGLLVADGPQGDPQGYFFAHRTLREYLASVALADDLTKNGLGEVSIDVLRLVARGEQASPMTLPHGELNRILADATARPDTWAEVLALTAGAPGLGGADRLVRRVAAAGDRRLLLRVVADAEGLQPDTVDAALSLDRGWSLWQERKKILEDLPAMVGDPAAVVSLLRRFVQSTTDGNDLYWAREGLKDIAAGDFLGLAVESTVQQEAAEGVKQIFDHIPADRLVRAQMLMKPWWREIRSEPFRMGSPEGEGHDRERPQHLVELTKGFNMLAVPVTWGMYWCFDPDHDVARDDIRAMPASEQEQHPVYNVTWYAATMFAAWVAGRLPMEAEWEFACRGGRTTRYWSGNTEDNLAQIGWYDKNSDGRPHRVAEKQTPNHFGLHDMHGNVWEWCLDVWDPDAYTRRRCGVVVDPVAATIAEGGMAPVAAAANTRGSRGAHRVIRGGAWITSSDHARAAWRFKYTPAFLGEHVGFRLVNSSVASRSATT